MPSSLDDARLGARNSKPLAFLSEFPQGAAERIKALLAASADRHGAEYYLAEFHARHPNLLAQIAATRPRLQWLITMFGFSRFLSEELLQHPDWLNDVPDVYRVLTVSDYSERLAWFLAERSAGVSALDLALFRRREIFRIAVRDALNFGTLSEITEELSKGQIKLIPDILIGGGGGGGNAIDGLLGLKLMEMIDPKKKELEMVDPKKKEGDKK